MRPGISSSTIERFPEPLKYQQVRPSQTRNGLRSTSYRPPKNLRITAGERAYCSNMRLPKPNLPLRCRTSQLVMQSLGEPTSREHDQTSRVRLPLRLLEGPARLLQGVSSETSF